MLPVKFFCFVLIRFPSFLATTTTFWQSCQGAPPSSLEIPPIGVDELFSRGLIRAPKGQFDLKIAGASHDRAGVRYSTPPCCLGPAPLCSPHPDKRRAGRAADVAKARVPGLEGAEGPGRARVAKPRPLLPQTTSDHDDAPTASKSGCVWVIPVAGLIAMIPT